MHILVRICVCLQLGAAICSILIEYFIEPVASAFLESKRRMNICRCWRGTHVCTEPMLLRKVSVRFAPKIFDCQTRIRGNLISTVSRGLSIEAAASHKSVRYANLDDNGNTSKLCEDTTVSGQNMFGSNVLWAEIIVRCFCHRMYVFCFGICSVICIKEM